MQRGGGLYGCLACACTYDRLVQVIIVYKQLLQISIINDWNIEFVGYLGWGLRVATAHKSLTLTTLNFTYTQDRDNHRITYGLF